MISLPLGLYNCKMVIGLGDRTSMNISDRQEMWDLWKLFRDNLFKEPIYKNKIVLGCLSSTYPILDEENKSLEKWGCIGDIETSISLITGDDYPILSPIEFEFLCSGNPPLKWCDFMRKQGFFITIYFLDNDISQLYNISGNCGKCIYERYRMVEELYTMPTINYTEAELYYKKYDGLRKFMEYRDDIYSLEGFCHGLKSLLDVFGVGPCSEGIMLYEKFKIRDELDNNEQKLTTGIINEGEYLEKCNFLKQKYDDIKFPL